MSIFKKRKGHHFKTLPKSPATTPQQHFKKLVSWKTKQQNLKRNVFVLDLQISGGPNTFAILCYIEMGKSRGEAPPHSYNQEVLYFLNTPPKVSHELRLVTQDQESERDGDQLQLQTLN